MPGANLEVKNPDTNFSRSLTTDTDGRFVFLQLSPGRYTLTISKQGFATLVPGKPGTDCLVRQFR
ncbi:MAG: carboxypeptidase-like regulatory domain-containing protein [Acidobacteriota bacterium]